MNRNRLLVVSSLALILNTDSGFGQSLEQLPIADTHVHYSHDSVAMTPPERVIELMREAHLKLALVSSSDDDGTQLLRELAPDLIVPGLRPYTRRGETGSWFTREANLAYVENLLQRNRYASIGEFHLFGDSADLPIPRRIVALAAEHNLILHAHSDAEAVERLLAQDPGVKVIWAHAGFAGPEEIGAMFAKHDRLWADLAFRSDVGAGGKLDEDWIALFNAYPERLMLGTDTYTPERIHFIPVHARNARAWLDSLPEDLAERVAWKNAYNLVMPVWKTNREAPAIVQTKAEAQTRTIPGDLPADSVPALTPEVMADVSCDHSDARFVLEQDDLTVSIEPIGEISVSQPFPVSVTVCGDDAGAADVTLDASMPAHGHGMNYSPTHEVVARNEQGQQLRVEGVVLHMPGDWQWAVEVRTKDYRSTLTRTFEVR